MSDDGPQIDDTVADPARRHSYWSGGKDNIAADRESGDEVACVYPQIVDAVQANRDFLTRAVRAAARRGRTQFLDIGCGLPLPDATHEVAEAVVPEARTAYVDHNPMVLTHARALLTPTTAAGEVTVIDGDLRNPSQILADLTSSRSSIDRGKPVVLVLGAVLHFLTDADKPVEVVRVLVDALAPGSVLIVSHASYQPLKRKTRKRLNSAEFKGVGTFTPRSKAKVRDLFRDVVLIRPGLVVVSKWRPDPNPDAPHPPANRIAAYGGVGVKTGRPARRWARLREIPDISAF